MGYRSDDKYMIYPLYFDKHISRRKGRRIPKKFAVEKPTIQVLFNAAKSLGFHPELQKESSHPHRQWNQEGCIFIDKKDSKQSMLQQIAKGL